MNLILYYYLITVILISRTSIFAFEIDSTKLKMDTNSNKTSEMVMTTNSNESIQNSTIQLASIALTTKQTEAPLSAKLTNHNLSINDAVEDNISDTETDYPPVNVPSLTIVSTLQEDLFEFIDLIPIEEINELRIRYYASSPDVRRGFSFLTTYNYSFISTQLIEMPEVKKVWKFFVRKNVDLKEVGKALYERVGPITVSNIVERGNLVEDRF